MAQGLGCPCSLRKHRGHLGPVPVTPSVTEPLPPAGRRTAPSATVPGPWPPSSHRGRGGGWATPLCRHLHGTGCRRAVRGQPNSVTVKGLRSRRGGPGGPREDVMWLHTRDREAGSHACPGGPRGGPRHHRPLPLSQRQPPGHWVSPGPAATPTHGRPHAEPQHCQAGGCKLRPAAKSGRSSSCRWVLPAQPSHTRVRGPWRLPRCVMELGGSIPGDCKAPPPARPLMCGVKFPAWHPLKSRLCSSVRLCSPGNVPISVSSSKLSGAGW